MPPSRSTVPLCRTVGLNLTRTMLVSIYANVVFALGTLGSAHASLLLSKTVNRPLSFEEHFDKILLVILNEERQHVFCYF